MVVILLKETKEFSDWIKSLKDSSIVLRIRSRLNRIVLGNFGDSKSVGDGVYELRFFFGGGIRIYYGYIDGIVVLLLTGGNKGSQLNDIAKAKEIFKREKLKNDNTDI